MGKLQKTILSSLVGIAGFASLYILLRGYGFDRIALDLSALGWGFLFVALSFLPTFLCAALSWWVLTDFPARSRGPWAQVASLSTISVVANAWNNLAPFVKALGEPVRTMLLGREMPVRQAVRSVILFNLAQAIGSISAFSLGAIAAPLLFPLSGIALRFSLGVAGVAFLLNLAAAFLLFRPGRGRKSPRSGRWRHVSHWLLWIGHQLRKYARNRPGRFCAGIALAIAARITEGFVLYVIFAQSGHALPLLDSVMLNLGRGVADNAFFFVPYQVGTRELSMVFVMSQLLHRPEESAIQAALVFRLGELVWICGGFALWLLLRRPSAAGVQEAGDCVATVPAAESRV